MCRPSFTFVLILGVLGTALGLYAQVPTATVTGTVADSKGAIVVGATVAVHNQATNETHSGQTNHVGQYWIGQLPVGQYDIRVTMDGFKSAITSGVTLNVNQVAVLNYSLSVGQVTERVDVAGQAALIQSADSQVGTVIENRQVVDLPLNGRNFIQLNRLIPGVVGAPPGNAFDGNSGQTNAAFSVNGQRIYSNEFYVDGVNTTQSQTQTNTFSPSIDAIQEFQLQTSNHDAAFGQGAAGQVNLVTKSGTNDLHGSLYEFLRNDAADARNFFALEQSPYRQNQFGGSFGGPVYIPRLYNGKSKTFFFGSYEGLRIRQTFTATLLVPTAAQKEGIFSSPVQDPTTGNPFPGNTIPTSRIDPISTKLLQYFPGPNTASSAGNFVTAAPIINDTNFYSVRVDHELSSNASIFVRYLSQTRSNEQPNGGLPGFSTSTQHRGKNFVIAFTQALGVNVVNDFRFAYNQDYVSSITGRSFNDNVVGSLGILGLSDANPRDWRVPIISITGLAGVGDAETYVIPHHIFQWRDDLSYHRGAHTFRFGANIQRHRYTFSQALNPEGVFSFTGQFSGNGFADFLLGSPASAYRSLENFDPNFRTTWFGAYIKDDWRTSKRLTLNLGLRYDYDTKPISTNNTIATFDPNLGQLVYPGQAGYPKSLRDPEYKNFGPRLGLAYGLTNDGKTVLRAGYGIYYQVQDTNEDVDLAINPPFVTQNNPISDFTTPTISFQDPFNVSGGGGGDTPVLIFGMSRHFPDAYAQEWSFNVQRSLFAGALLEIGYLGNKLTHLTRYLYINQPPPAPGPVQPRRPYQDFGTIFYIQPSATSTYNGLQVKVEKRYSKGLSLLASYTFSKAIDNASSTLLPGGQGEAEIQDSRNERAERGLSLFDTRHVFVVSYVYELPVGKQRALKLTGPVDWILGGWELAGITTVRSGQPFSVILGENVANVGDGTNRPDVIRNPNLPSSKQTIEHFFDTSAFVQQAPFTFGNAGRNIVIGPGSQIWDVSLMKPFKFRETHQLVLRFDAFNTFNHPTFDKPDNTFLSPTFGVITRAEAPRQIQVGLRYSF